MTFRLSIAVVIAVLPISAMDSSGSARVDFRTLLHVSAADSVSSDSVPRPRVHELDHEIVHVLSAEESRDLARLLGARGPGADRFQHASLSFASGIGIGVITREPGVAAGGALTLGIGKELLDARRDRFDAGDLIADFIGASLAALVIAALER